MQLRASGLIKRDILMSRAALYDSLCECFFKSYVFHVYHTMYMQPRARLFFAWESLAQGYGYHSQKLNTVKLSKMNYTHTKYMYTVSRIYRILWKCTRRYVGHSVQYPSQENSVYISGTLHPSQYQLQSLKLSTTRSTDYGRKVYYCREVTVSSWGISTNLGTHRHTHTHTHTSIHTHTPGLIRINSCQIFRRVKSDKGNQPQGQSCSQTPPCTRGKGLGTLQAFSWSCAPSRDCMCSNTNLCK